MPDEDPAPSTLPREPTTTAVANGLAPTLAPSEPAGANSSYANVDCNGKSVLEAPDGYLVPAPAALPFGGGAGASGDREYENVAVPERAKVPASLLGGKGRPLMLPPKPASALQACVTTAATPDKDLDPAATEEIESAAGDSAAEDTQVNYIPVDFVNTPSNGCTSPGVNAVSATSGTLSFMISQEQKQQALLSPTSEDGDDSKMEYCTIDIDKTQALSKTAMQQSARGAQLML